MSQTAANCGDDVRVAVDEAGHHVAPGRVDLGGGDRAAGSGETSTMIPSSMRMTPFATIWPMPPRLREGIDSE